MATFAGRKLQDIFDNVAGTLAVEWLPDCQGLDLRTPLKTSIELESLKALLRSKVGFYDGDR